MDETAMSTPHEQTFIHLDELGGNVSMEIKCNTEVVVTAEGGVSAFGGEFDLCYMIIVLQSAKCITNNGKLSTNGSGDRLSCGTICLSAKEEINNHGIIQTKHDGYIAIQCRAFVNSGTVEPEPDIFIISENDNADTTPLVSLRSEVNRLLFFLQRYPKRIDDGNEIYHRFGITFDSDWLPLIVKRPNLLNETNYENKNIRHRLAYELWIFPSIVIAESDEFGNAVCRNGSTVFLSNKIYIPDSVIACIPRCLFGVSINGQIQDEKYRFDHVLDFQIPTDSISAIITLWVEPIDGSLQPIDIKSLSPSSSRYNLHRMLPLLIRNTVRVNGLNDGDALNGNGTFEIQCNTNIEIAVDGGINADGAGLLTEQCILYHQSQRALQGVKDEGISEKLFLKFGTISAFFPNHSTDCGGGIILLRSQCDIRNYGVLSSNGSLPEGPINGGTICLCADGAVENHGRIDCRPNGRIIVQCREFLNDGMISSEMELIINEGSEKREIEMLLLTVKIPLSVYRHRRHRRNKDYYHPQNLLDKEGTGSRYLSHIPVVGDWIVFKLEIEFAFIPTWAIVRNDPSGFGLKCIELSLAMDGDGEEFEPFAVIEGIHRDNDKEQYFNLKNKVLKNNKIWNNKYKFMKLRIIENWGRRKTSFYSFAVFGQLESNLSVL